MQADEDANLVIDQWLAQVQVVLVNTSHPGNIGGTARAMKNMGLNHLTLVNPVSYPDEQATARASGAENILEKATLASNLDEALSDCTLVMGTSARNRHIAWPLLTPQKASEYALQQFPLAPFKHDDQQIAQAPVKIALVFGTEKSGLTNEDLHKCHAHIHIPTQSNFSSLNLAAAVQVLCYQLRCSCLDAAMKPLDQAFSDGLASKYSQTLAHLDTATLATNHDMELMFAHLQTTLTELEFLDADNPRQLMTRLRRLFMRSQMEKMEVNIIRGILTAAQKNSQT